MHAHGFAKVVGRTHEADHLLRYRIPRFRFIGIIAQHIEVFHAVLSILP